MATLENGSAAATPSDPVSAPGATPTSRLDAWLAAFGDALDRCDVPAAVDLFDSECYWRDLVALTWNVITLDGKDSISAMLSATLTAAKPTNWRADGTASDGDCLEGFIKFETATARAKGYLRLRQGKCWTMMTAMEELKGFEPAQGPTRDMGAVHGAEKGRRSWGRRRKEEVAQLGVSVQPQVVIVGGGQAGIMLGARLVRLGVPAIILERRARPGDSWRHRYDSLATHDPVWMNHLPFIPFPTHWPTYFPKDKIADWLEMYVKVMELNYWGGSACTAANYDDAAGVWKVKVDREGKEVTLWPRHLVVATGVHGAPAVPDIPGAASFKGTQVHSSDYKGDEQWQGLKCVIIGSNNSAHDVCHDLWERGALPTMIQRSTTHVTRSAVWQDMYVKPLYSEEAVASGITHDKADMIFASIPYKIHAVLDVPIYTAMAKRDAPFYKRLTDAGFLLDFGEDGSGLFMKWLRRGSGFYIDTGASDLISDGSIALKSGVSVDHINETSVTLTDGTVLPADAIVYATGWSNLSASLAKLTSPEVAEKVGRVWGLGSGTTGDPGPWEGELRNMYKPTPQPGLWILGGSFMQCRFYSQFVALQLQARVEGVPTPVYTGPPQPHAT